MPRKERLYIQGLPQLIKLKGHNHDVIFTDKNDYDYFNHCVDKAIKRFPCDLHAYTLLPQQVLLLLTPRSKDTLSRFIQHIGRCYVAYYNKKYHRSGALWEGRYNNCLIEPDAWFLLVQQYVDTFSSIVNDADAQNRCPGWSSLRHNTGKEALTRLSPHSCYQQLGKSRHEQSTQYRRFLQTAISPTVQRRIQQCLSQNCVLGTPKFCQQLEVQLHRRVRPRHCGRPHKHVHNQVAGWVWLEEQAINLLQRYCYQEIRLPLLQRWQEPHSVMCTFHLPEVSQIRFVCDNRALLREEGTTSCLQFIQQHQALQSSSRLWYLGAMFRADETQGHLVQQYHQLGVEAFGYASLDIELEQLLLQSHFFEALQLTQHVELKINTVGTREEFLVFRQQLHDYFQPYADCFTPRWLNWLIHTPEKLLRISDPRLTCLQKMAPKLHHFLSPASMQRFEQLVVLLTRFGIPFVIDDTLYPDNSYCHTIFEWWSNNRGAADRLCRGGRYDESAGSAQQPVYACGFAFMLEPIMHLLQLTHKNMLWQTCTDVVIIPQTGEARGPSLMLGRMLRTTFPQMSIVNDCSQQRITVCKRNATRQGGRFVVIVPPPPSEQCVELTDKESGQKREVELNTLINLLGHSLNM
ncbi:ATP phosphoribosyltransferase regulatory subunit [Enterobacteriaceae bacterium LUAb1]